MQLVGDEANRVGSVAGGGAELEVGDHHLAKSVQHARSNRVAA